MSKRSLLMCLVFTVLAFSVFTACAGVQPVATQPTAASAATAAPAASAKPDVLNMSWDQIVEQAKAEKDVVFYAWWGEEYWKEAARLFNEKYGMNAKVIVADNVVDKLLAEKDKEVGTVDVQL
ncbi:MAG TPA: hypothetical protein VFD70_15620, partial [Anaerolineae bacterium]|nr:hypothetical protein [Anaerolineae bacterium]